MEECCFLCGEEGDVQRWYFSDFSIQEFNPRKKNFLVCESCFFNRCNACGLVFSCSKHFDLHRLGIIDNNIIFTIIVIAIIFIIALTIIIIIILFIRVVKGRVPKKNVESLVFC